MPDAPTPRDLDAITPDERAALRALADRMETYYGEADAASGIQRLLDALDTAEAERDQARAEVAVARQHQREASLTIRSVEGLRKERDDALAEVARLRAARPAPVWDEDTPTTDEVREAWADSRWDPYGEREWSDHAAEFDRYLATVQAEALRDAAATLDLPGATAALGYYASEEVAGYTIAERDTEAWLDARADRLDPKEK